MTDLKYYTAQVVEDTISVLDNDLRNLHSALLSSYYELAELVSAAEVEARYQESAAFRAAAGLPIIPKATFASQLSEMGGKELFLQLLNAAGIETEYTEDLVELSVADKIPELGRRTAFTDQQRLAGRTLSVSAVRDKFRAMEGLSGLLASDHTTKHLVEAPTTMIADDDSKIQARVDSMLNYLRRWLR
jgi:hypothetical protein